MKDANIIYPISRSLINSMNVCKIELNQVLSEDMGINCTWQVLSCAAKITALAIAEIAVFIFESIIIPLRISQYKTALEAQLQSDISQIDPNSDVQAKVDALFNDILSLDTLPENEKEKAKRCALATYASTQTNYAPVVVKWVQSVLETAKTDGNKKRVVFLARDGIAPYEVAEILKERFPERYGDIDLSLLYISRKVKDWACLDENKETFYEYLQQEGLKTGEECLFIDIGFYGSLINPLRELLTKDKTSFHLNSIEFGYLVSHTEQAHGFTGDLSVKLESVRAAGQNPAVHWLEDTHQGVFCSAKMLKKLDNGRIQPVSDLKEDSLASSLESNPAEYAIKHFGMEAIKDFAKVVPVAIPEGAYEAWKKASKELRSNFDSYLMNFHKRTRYPLITH